MFGMFFWTVVGLILGWFVLPQPAWVKGLFDKFLGLFK